MDKKPKILCLINARGGSKGVPGKNIKPLGGKPLIAYSVEVGKQSQLISRVVVSTDAQNIADAARAAGADVPFLRPAELATDTAVQIDVIKHAVETVEATDGRYDFICILQPTCPFRSVGDLDGSLQLLLDSGADSVITVTEVGGRHPKTLYKIDEDKGISPYLDSPSGGVLRQNFEALYWRTGSVYAMKRDVVMAGSLYGSSQKGYIQEESRAFNIDSPFDWELCEAWLAYKQSRS